MYAKGWQRRVVCRKRRPRATEDSDEKQTDVGEKQRASSKLLDVPLTRGAALFIPLLLHLLPDSWISGAESGITVG